MPMTASLHIGLQQIFPPHGDPFAKGPKRFSAIIQIDAVPSDSATSKRYSPAIKGAEPANADDAIELANAIRS